MCDEWQPIETAPDDQELLVMRRDGVMHVARVSGFGARKYGTLNADFGNAHCSFFFPVGGNYDEDDDAPTHWMLLPEPPTTTA